MSGLRPLGGGFQYCATKKSELRSFSFVNMVGHIEKYFELQAKVNQKIKLHVSETYCTFVE
jgi:hypothetical protein